MKGKAIDSDGRNIILKVLQYFEEEKANNRLTFRLDQVTNRTCAATGISKRTLMTIKKEAKQLLQAAESDETSNGGKPKEIKLTKPGKKRKPSSRKIKLSNFELNALKNFVNSFSAEKKEVPTLRNMLTLAQRDLNFRGQKSTLRKILINELGFKFKRGTSAKVQKQKKMSDSHSELAQ